MTGLGILTMILGILAMLAPGLTGLSIAMLVGFLVAAGGVLRILWAVQAGSAGKGLPGLVIGGLTLLCGLALVANPMFASGVLTVVLGVYFIVDGLLEIAVSMQVRPFAGWGLMLFVGIVSLLLGVLIWSQFPLSGAYAIGILFGIKLFLIGLLMATTGSTIKTMADV